MNDRRGRSGRGVLLTLLLCLIAFSGRCHGPERREPAGAERAAPSVAEGVRTSTPPALPAAGSSRDEASRPDLFAASVRPILSTRCAPCHEPGGKMYGPLPFDQAAVVASNSKAISGRLKGEQRETLERWLATLPPAPPLP